MFPKENNIVGYNWSLQHKQITSDLHSTINLAIQWVPQQKRVGQQKCVYN